MLDVHEGLTDGVRDGINKVILECFNEGFLVGFWEVGIDGKFEVFVGDFCVGLLEGAKNVC